MELLGHQVRVSPALEYLRERTLHGVKLGLDAPRRLLRELGDPQDQYPTLLVAGTNGKGSVVAYLDAILTASGLRCGRYTSPHLERVNERITVAGEEIGDDALDAAIEDVRRAAERLLGLGKIEDHPTFFETLTVAAFHHCARARTDVVVAEVGMGGRLDATNVCTPTASAIVTIGFDHTQFLGDSLASIAREKAGVLRTGRPTVIGQLCEEARDAVQDQARACGARVVEAHAGARIEPPAAPGEPAVVVTPRRTFRGLPALSGRHQLDNLLVALRLLQEADGLGWSPAVVPNAIAGARWPGRLERIEGPPVVILDGAHNLEAAEALAEYLRSLPPAVLVFGAMRDKPIAQMLAALVPGTCGVVLTHAPSGRAAEPEAIRRASATLLGDSVVESDPLQALERARAMAGARGIVVVAGSLYLVGAVRGHLVEESGAARR